MKKVFKTLGLLTFLSLSLWACLTSISIYSFGQVDETTQADAAIVLGAAVHRERPSPVFRERINHAIRLYQQGLVEALIFTGGVGRNDDLAEAEAARTYAMDAGVPESVIYIETESTDTLGNLQGAQAIMQAHSFESALIVSDPLHMQRAMHFAEEVGLRAYSSPTPTTRYESVRSQLWFLVREVLFSMGSALFGEASPALPAWL